MKPTIDALLDAHRVPWGRPPDDAQLAAESEKAANQFRRTKNPMHALHAAQLAAAGHLPLPRNVAEWLTHGIGYYLHGRRPSLDDALGLKKPGRASPHRQIKDDAHLKAALGRMLGLQIHGATIPQAAALVGSLSPDHAASTLESHYRRGGYSAVLKNVQALDMHAMDPEGALAEYPDRPLVVKQAKAAIRALYAKRRP